MVTVVLKSGTKWFVPADCQTATIEAVGAGSGLTGDGGAYSKSVGVALTPGSTATISIGAGGSGSAVWFNTESVTAFTPSSMAWTGSQLAGFTPTREVTVSSDGKNWTTKPGAAAILASSTGVRYVAGNADTLVAVASSDAGSATIAVLSNGGTLWTAGSLPFQATSAYGIQYVNGFYTLMTQRLNGVYHDNFVSVDGVTWSLAGSMNWDAEANSSMFLYADKPIGFDGTRYFRCGQTVVADAFVECLGYSSTGQGNSWTMLRETSLQMQLGSKVTGVAFGNGWYVVVNDKGQISRATNLAGPWSPIQSGLTGFQPNITGIYFDGAKFIAPSTTYSLSSASASGCQQVLTSEYGDIWELVDTTQPVVAFNSSFVDGMKVVGGGTTSYLTGNYSGVSKTTDSGSTWARLISGTGSPVSASTGVAAAGGSSSPILAQAVLAIYTSGTGNRFIGGNRGTGYSYTDCCNNTSSLQSPSGGSAGPHGNGGNGGNSLVLGGFFSGGGGGANGGANGFGGVTGNGGAGGAGGAGRLGASLSPGGAGGTSGAPTGGNGVGGGGGGGSQEYYSVGGNGSLDAGIWTDYLNVSHGVGGGNGGGSSGGVALAGGPGGGGLGTLGQGMIIITYTPQPVAGQYTQVFTSSQDVYLPAGITSLTAEAIGPGSSGYFGGAASNFGGGGGAYAAGTTTTIEGSTAGYAYVPAALAYGSTDKSWFRFSNTSIPAAPSAPTAADQGVSAAGASSGVGGSVAASVGTPAKMFAGGAGGLSVLTTATTVKLKGGGGGGAAGRDGVGMAGGSAYATGTSGSGGGGGGSNGLLATAGSIGASTVGGAGGKSSGGTSGGLGSTSSLLAAAGTLGSGGGAGNNSSTTVTTRRDGAAGSQFDVVPGWQVNGVNYGPGAGGGGAGANTTLGGKGGAGGGYGAGGGAGSISAGAGSSGLVVITYTVASSGTTSGPKPLASSASAVAAVTAATSVAKPLAATASAVAAVTADISVATLVSKPLASSASAVAAVTAATSVAKPLAATASAVAAVTADILAATSGSKPLAATASVTATMSAGLSVSKPLATSMAAAAAVVAAISKNARLASALTASSTITAAVATASVLAATMYAAASASASLSVGLVVVQRPKSSLFFGCNF